MHRKQVLYPFLALLVTTLAFTLVLFSVFLSSSGLFRLLQGPTASFYSLPFWLRHCLLHPALLKTLARVGFGVSLLGAMLTLFLLLKTEPPNKAYGHLAGIGWAMLLMTVIPFGIFFGTMVLSVVSRSLSWGGLAGQLRSLLPDLPKAVVSLFAFSFVVVIIPFSLSKIIGRLRASAPARQTPHVLQ